MYMIDYKSNYATNVLLNCRIAILFALTLFREWTRFDHRCSFLFLFETKFKPHIMKYLSQFNDVALAGIFILAVLITIGILVYNDRHKNRI